MPKGFIYFLVIAQAILTALFFTGFEVAKVFFPVLGGFQTSLLTLVILLSFTPLLFIVVTHNRDVGVLNWSCTFSLVFLIFVFYFVLASLPILILFWIFALSPAIAGWTAFILSAGLTIYGVINARIARVSSIKITLPNLPEFWQGKTAVMVSDLHLGQILRVKSARKAVNLINKLKPEIVFIPGDFYDGGHTDFKALADEFKNIIAPLGTFFCSGNHEVFAGYEICEQSIKDAGIKILENQKIEIQGLQIAGVAYKSDKIANLKEIFDSLFLDKTKPSILLKHVPFQIEEAEAAGFSMQLSGHSHQGQIWPGQHITAPLFKGFDYGLKRLNNLLVYTSSGLGTWGPPMRVFTKAEILKITFI